MITITVPDVDSASIEAVQAETQTTHATEVQAIAALREKYAQFARHAGNIKIGRRANGDSNYSFDHAAYYRAADGRKVHGLLACDKFSQEKTGEWHGTFGGCQLYLTADGWIEIERSGTWSCHANTTDQWSCGEVDFGDNDESAYPDYVPPTGGVSRLTDEQVVAGHKLTAICADLSASLRTLNEKLPERLTRIRQRAVVASQLLAALK